MLMFLGAGAGCMQPAGEGTLATAIDGTTLVLSSLGDPIPFAQAAAYDNELVAVLSANTTGHLRTAGLTATSLRVWAPGHDAAYVSLAEVPSVIVLETNPEARPPSESAFLHFDEPVGMMCDDPVWNAKRTAGQTSGVLDPCGGSEPELVVAQDGAIWLSSTVILGSAPPIWVSRDHGKTFDLFRGEGTGVLRETQGTETSMAVDAANNLYILDENFAINWFTSYAADGTHRWSHPFPFVPKTHDRPFVRANNPDEVVIVYSDQHLKPRTSYMFRSDDGGLTWPATPEHEWPCAQILEQGPTRNDLMLVGALGCDGTAGNFFFEKIFVRLSNDFGKTWSEPELAPVPQGEFDYRAIWVIVPPVADADGNVYVTYTHATNKDASEVDIFVSRRSPDGVWSGPFRLGLNGTNVLAGPTAGQGGRFALTFYHTDAGAHQDHQTDAKWYAMAALSLDADEDDPHFQVARIEERPVFEGPGMHTSENGWGRTGNFLADFTSSEFTPDGRLAVAYSRSDVNQHFFSQPHFAQTLTRPNP